MSHWKDFANPSDSINLGNKFTCDARVKAIFRKICPWEAVILVIRLFVEAGPDDLLLTFLIPSYLVNWWIVFFGLLGERRKKGVSIVLFIGGSLSVQVIWLIGYSVKIKRKKFSHFFGLPGETIHKYLVKGLDDM